MRTRDLFKNRDFRYFQISRFGGTLAWQIQAVAVGWQVYELTGKTLDLGLAGLAQFFPLLLFMPWTGMIADRYDRRRVSALGHLIQAFCSLGFLGLSLLDRPPVYWFFALLFVKSTSRAFSGPANQSIIPSIVSRQALPRAVAVGTAAWQMGTIIGPALGGFLYALSHRASLPHLVSFVVFSFSTLATMRMRPITGHLEHKEEKHFLAGLHYVLKNRILLGALSLDLFAVLLGGAVALLPAYAKDILHAGPFELGLLRSAPSIGAAFMALWIAKKPITRHAGQKMFIAVMIFGLATVALGFSIHLETAMLCLFVIGASDLVSVVIRQVLVQVSTPNEMRGRVAAVNLAFIGGSNELGEFESGITAAFFGLVPAIILGGVGTGLVVLFWALKFPELLRVDELVS